MKKMIIKINNFKNWAQEEPIMFSLILSLSLLILSCLYIIGMVASL